MVLSCYITVSITAQYSNLCCIASNFRVLIMGVEKGRGIIRMSGIISQSANCFNSHRLIKI